MVHCFAVLDSDGGLSIAESATAVLTCVPSTSRTTREMEALNTPPSMAVAAHMAYTPGCMFQSGSQCISNSPHVPPKEPPTCTLERNRLKYRYA